MNVSKTGPTLEAWVCCSMTSETSVAYGSDSVRRHG